MSDFSETRRWWPDCLVDEHMPEGRKRPEDWLAPDENGVTTVIWDEDDPHLAVAGFIKPGETAAFNWWEDRGRVEITVLPDGTWQASDMRGAGMVDMFTGAETPMPPAALIEDANYFAEVTDHETAADSMDEFARYWADNDRPGPDGERLTVVMGFWSEKVEFVVSAAGRSLTPVGGGNG